MNELAVTINSGGRQLVGIFHAAGAARGPAVLMLHGFTGNKQETKRIFVQEARALARAGISSLRFDFFGCGDSEGAFSDMTVSTMVADAQASLAWLNARPEVDPARVALLGMSLGGMVAALTLREVSAFTSVVLWAPVTNPRRLIASRATPVNEQQIMGGGVADFGGWPVGRTFVLEMMAADPVAALQAARLPMLVIHGDADASVPFEDSVVTVDALKMTGHEITFVRLPGCDHGFSSLAWIAELLETTTAWFRGRV